ncbi:MAG: response regulator transcription factor [Bacilli bacterium]|nr:response regulator transcription factor [Bacilli bacterium]
MKILVVDDESLIREVIIEYLKLEKMEYQEASDGYQAIELVKNEDFDVVIMDIMMPKMDGYQAVKEIRKFSKVPFIMLSARSEEYDKLTCFDIGVDDYVTKPFSPRELIARIKAVTKRNQKNQVSYKFQGLEVDVEAHEVFVDGKKLNLTPKEYDLLIYLIENKNIALTRENLLTNIWGYDFFGDDRTVDTHVKTLRNSLGKYRDFITTVRKVGYKFDYKE